MSDLVKQLRRMGGINCTFADLVFEAADRIAELEVIENGECPNCALLENDVERLRESETFFAERCGDAELKLLNLEATLAQRNRELELLLSQACVEGATHLQDLNNKCAEVERLEAENQTAWNACDEAETHANRLHAKLNAVKREVELNPSGASKELQDILFAQEQLDG